VDINELYTFIDSSISHKEKIKRYSNENLTIAEIDENNVSINYKNSQPIIFNDTIYSLGYFCNKIQTYKRSTTFEKKINFSQFNSNNIFGKNLGYTKSFINERVYQ